VKVFITIIACLCLYKVFATEDSSTEPKLHKKHDKADKKHKNHDNHEKKDNPKNEAQIDSLDRKVLPKRDHSKLEFPHFESNEIDLNSQKEALEEAKHNDPVHETGPRGQEIVNGKVLLGRGIDLNVPLPIYLPVGRKGNYEIEVNKEGHTGPGEFGAAVHTEDSEKEHVQEVIKEFGFNLVNSDKISMDRLPKDLRDETCKRIDYPTKLPRVSVIVVFHNEGWGPLVRTFHSVVNMTPKELLGEIVIIDDGSIIKDKPHLGDPLEEYIKQWNGLVKLFRNERREGLIRARSIGASHATEEVLVFLDAHCECGYNWLPPLIAPIARNDRLSTVPLIDVIDGNRFTFTGQAGGDSNGRAQGGWEWNFLWKRYPLPKKESDKLGDKSEPYPSPAMAGGLFAINRKYFEAIGRYDPGLEIWGGENFEISYKLWMCGGGLLFVPCSRVGHVYRLEGWGGNPPPEYVPSNPSFRNYRRVIDVWWDDWAKYFYWNRPELQKLDAGDISEQIKFREDHCPYDFDWFMKEIAYGITEQFDWPPELLAWGEIRGIGTNLCIDSMGHKDRDGNAQTWYCHKQGGNQLWRLNDANQIAQNLQCLYPTSAKDKLDIMHCKRVDSPDNDFKLQQNGQLTYKDGCLTRKSNTEPGDLEIKPCEPDSDLQTWEVNEEAVF